MHWRHAGCPHCQVTLPNPVEDSTPYGGKGCFFATRPVLAFARSRGPPRSFVPEGRPEESAIILGPFLPLEGRRDGGPGLPPQGHSQLRIVPQLQNGFPEPVGSALDDDSAFPVPQVFRHRSVVGGDDGALHGGGFHQALLFPSRSEVQTYASSES